jgi:hypothetical protein
VAFTRPVPYFSSNFFVLRRSRFSLHPNSNAESSAAAADLLLLVTVPCVGGPQRLLIVGPHLIRRRRVGGAPFVVVISAPHRWSEGFISAAAAPQFLHCLELCVVVFYFLREQV